MNSGNMHRTGTAEHLCADLVCQRDFGGNQFFNVNSKAKGFGKLGVEPVATKEDES